VMGCIVQHLGWQGYAGCGLYGRGFGGGFGGGYGGVAGYQTPPGYAGYAPYVDALYRGVGTSLSRLAAEASAMSADGVVGVRLVETSMGGGNREFMAMGTAVRADSTTRPARMFVTDLSGPDLAKAMLAGWVPVNIVYGITVAIRHDDYTTRMQARSWSSANVEVSGYTELVQYARADARQRFDASARADHADSATVTSMTLSVWEVEPSDGHRDHVAEARVFGNSLARFHAGRHAVTTSRTVLPLTT
jgi:uncharacterized protein YbjQ (UPF0145 family)